MDGQTTALTFAERARRVVEEDAKAYDLMAAKAALFDEMRFALNEFMRLNAGHQYEFDTNEKAWYDETDAILQRANKIAEAK